MTIDNTQLLRELKRKREGKKRKVETLDLVEEDDDEIRWKRSSANETYNPFVGCSITNESERKDEFEKIEHPDVQERGANFCNVNSC